MTAFFRACLIMALPLSLTACGGNSARYLLDAPSAEQRARVAVSTIEIREVTLPAYAGASEILLQGADGSLRPAAGAVWADDPVRALTLALARNLDDGTTATAAAEPWPLEEPADVRVEVRIERMVAQSDGQFRMTGQYAIAAPERAVRESINRFDILQPVTDATPGAVAQATGAAMLTLSRQIATRLRR